MRSAISLISHNEIENSIVRCFCMDIAAIKSPCPKYDYVWDPAAVIAKLSSIYSYDSVLLKLITRKLIFLFVFGRVQISAP